MDIAFCADKGGVGKSTLAYHVATRLRQLGHDVGLLDLDRRSASSAWVGLAAEPYFPAYALTSLNGRTPSHEVRVWDTPAHPSRAMKQELARYDQVIVVAQADVDSQLAAADLCAELLALGVPARILFNAMHPTSTEARDAIAEARSAGLPVFDGYVRSYNCYRHARWDGRAVCDYPYPSADKAWADISDLTGELLARVEERHATSAAGV